ncbi:hypothetical protein L345_08891, partial [Ophiophagus hannah]
MTPQQHWTNDSKETQPEQLPNAGILGGQSEGREMLVMDLVEIFVEPWHLVMEQMPQKGQEVEQQQASSELQEKRWYLGSDAGQAHRPPVPMRNSYGEDAHEVVIDALGQAKNHHLQGRRRLRLDFILPQDGDPRA